jgi:uncharacterized protein YqhQ
MVDAPSENAWAAERLAREEGWAGRVEPISSPDDPEALPEMGTRRLSGVALTLVVLNLLPQAVTGYGLRALNVLAPPTTVTFQMATGIVFLAGYAAYLLAARRLARRRPRIASVLRYHAAVNATLWSASAAGVPAPPDLRTYPGWHPQGSAVSIVLVVIADALAAAGLSAFIPVTLTDGIPGHVTACALRVLFVPILLGAVGELQRVLARFGRHELVRLALAPFLALARLAILPPTDDNLAVGGAALRELRKLEEDDK